MIFILHHNRYWTEYLSFLLNDKNNFLMVASQHATEDYDNEYSLKRLPKFNCKLNECILSPGRIFDPLENTNKIIIRFMHSPGFFVYPMIRAYADLITQNKVNHFKFIVLEEYYRCLVNQDFENEGMDYFKFLFMNDSRIYRSEVNPTLFKIFNAPKTIKREIGRGLVALSWLLIDNDFNFFIKICKYLQKHLKLTLLLHPLMRLNESVVSEIKKYQGILFEEIYYNLRREELINLYDRHEYIISDGSGSCYEGMIRGCIPLSVKGMQMLPKEAGFNLSLPEEYFPFPDYQEITTSKKFDSDSFIKKYFPYLFQYTQKEAEIIATKEIFKVYHEFNINS